MSEKIKVSELNESLTTNDEDLIMIVQENSDNELENFKQTRANFLASVTPQNMEVTTNKVTSLSSSSTDTQYPSAKCVYDYIGNVVGDIGELLDTIQGEVI